MATLSKTARASMRTETGGVKRTPVAYIFKRKGGMQTRPFYVSYQVGEAEQLLKEWGEEQYYIVKWGR